MRSITVGALALLAFSSAARGDEPGFALGARARAVFVPTSFLGSFLTASTPTNGASLGIEFIYRKADYDVVSSLDFAFMSPDDGNYLAAGHDPAFDSHYVQFHDLNLLSADVSVIGHHSWAAAPWLELRYGAGVGLGLVLGDVVLTNNGPQCTNQNAGDLTKCYPISNGQPIALGKPTTEAQLKATEAPGQIDTAATPHRHVSQDKPPVMAVINVVVGFKFRLHRNLSTQIEVGFRDGMFVGGGLHAWF
jgi:hypothetical protein